MPQKMDAALASHTALFQRGVIDVLPGISTHRLTRFFCRERATDCHDPLYPDVALASSLLTLLSKRSLNGRTRPLAPLPSRTRNCIRARSMSLVLSCVASEIRSPQPCPPGGALHVRDRCHQVERLSPKCHGVEKAHGADGDVDAGGCQLAFLDEMVQPARDFLVGDKRWRTAIIARQITDAPCIGFLSVF